MQNLSCVPDLQKTPPRPTGLPLATKFIEVVAMDLKFYKGKTLLHMIDHTTRLSVTVILPYKKPDQIVNAIISIGLLYTEQLINF